MRASLRGHARERLDRRLRDVTVPARPHAGWIRAIRDALGMTTGQLSERLGITAQAVSSLEHSEAEGTIRLASLRKAADALDCDVLYVFVPRHRDGLSGMVRDRSRAVARRELAPIRHTMALEAQELDPQDDDEELRLLADELSRDSRALWARPST